MESAYVILGGWDRKRESQNAVEFNRIGRDHRRDLRIVYVRLVSQLGIHQDETDTRRMEVADWSDEKELGSKDGTLELLIVEDYQSGGVRARRSSDTRIARRIGAMTGVIGFGSLRVGH